MKSRLDFFANVIGIVACVVVAGLATTDYLERHSLKRGNPPSDYRVGESIETVPGLGGASRSLLFIVQSTCRFCTESLPFYRRLRETRDRSAPHVRFVAVCLEEQRVCEQYLAENLFRPDHVVSVDRKLLKVQGTPALVLIDASRRVLASWLGLLTDSSESEVERAIKSSQTAGVTGG